MCACDSVGGGLPVQMQAFAFCFSPTYSTTRREGTRKRRFSERRPQQIVFNGQGDKKRVISVRSPAGALSHTVRAKWVKRQRPN